MALFFCLQPQKPKSSMAFVHGVYLLGFLYDDIDCQFFSCLAFPYFALLLLQVLAVFFLYVRCTAINPADPGIFSRFDVKLMKDSKNNPELQGMECHSNPGESSAVSVVHHSPSSASRSSIAGNSGRKASIGESGGLDIPLGPESKKSRCCFNIGGLFCALFIKEDCHKREEITEQQGASGEDVLFCTLCNAEVLFRGHLFLQYILNQVQCTN